MLAISASFILTVSPVNDSPVLGDLPIEASIDEGENYYEAALRELKEETSIISVKLIKEIENKLTYIFKTI